MDGEDIGPYWSFSKKVRGNIRDASEEKKRAVSFPWIGINARLEV